MKVTNVHERVLSFDPGPLLDRLAAPADPLWPGFRWPPLRLDRGLEVGARGGHGPIRYHVDGYRPGKQVRFRFDRPHGLDGVHRFEAGPGRLRHVLEADVRGSMIWLWPLVVRPLHDALIEDAFDRAEGRPPRALSLRVRLLRLLLRR